MVNATVPLTDGQLELTAQWTYVLESRPLAPLVRLSGKGRADGT